MAKLIGGPYGLISGKLGNRVYYILNGKQVSRSTSRRKKPPTARELANWKGMKVAFNFAKTVGVFVDAGFNEEAKERNIQPRNAAVGNIRKQALKGDYPDIEIDYTKLVLSRGSLRGLTEPLVSTGVGLCNGIALRYSWRVELQDLDWPRCNDRVMLMGYCPEVADPAERACFRISSARRGAGTDMLDLPELFVGKLVEVYISVIGETRMQVADSQYLGTVIATTTI